LTNYFAGQAVEISGVAHLPKVAVADGDVRLSGLPEQQEIYYQLERIAEEDWQIIRSPFTQAFGRSFSRLGASSIGSRTSRSGPVARVGVGAHIGMENALTEETAEPFVQAATYHIFAVDGLRMAIIFGIFSACSERFGCHERFALCY
jgi:hypothetical protein